MHQIAGREVVAAVDDDVVTGHQIERIVALHPSAVQRELDLRIGRPQPLGGGFELAPPDVRFRVENLALEIRPVDEVEIGQAEPADSRRRKIERRRRAQAAHSDDEDAPRRQALLARDPDLGQRQMARITAQVDDRQTLHRVDATALPPVARCRPPRKR